MKRFNNLQQRIITGVIGSFFIISSIVGGNWSYFVAFLLIGQLCLYEFYRLYSEKDIFPNIIQGMIVGVFNYILMYFVVSKGISYNYFSINILFITSIFIQELYRRKKSPFLNIAITLLGIVYIILPLMLMHPISYRSGNYSYVPALVIMLMLWGNDSGAYTFGKLFGKNKLFERISPNKTWEGFFGGVFMSTSIGLIASFFFNEFTSLHFLGLGIIVGVLATYGDLLESMLKRNLQIKDSGTIIPGHGGFLDRFDGLLLITPIVYMFQLLINL